MGTLSGFVRSPVNLTTIEGGRYERPCAGGALAAIGISIILFTLASGPVLRQFSPGHFQIRLPPHST